MVEQVLTMHETLRGVSNIQIDSAINSQKQLVVTTNQINNEPTRIRIH